MAESSVIREFLVKLGFKTDDGAFQKFERGIEQATKTVVALATAVEGTSAAVVAGVARFADKFEQLYFAARRVGASATNIKAFDLAAQNFGATAGEARTSIEGLAQALRENPGNAGLLQGLGVSLTDTHGKARDLTDVMSDLGKAFAQQPMYVSEQYASMLGISEKTMLAMRNGDFTKEMARARKEMQNNGFDKAAQDAHRFMMQLRDLETQLQVFGAYVMDALQKKLGVSLKSINEWLQKNGRTVADRVVSAVLELLNVAEKFGAAALWLVNKLMALDKATDGWSTKLLAIGALLHYSGAGSIIGGVLQLGAAFARLALRMGGASAAATAFRSATAFLAGGSAAATALTGTAVVGAGIGLGWGLDKLFPNNPFAQMGDWLGSTVHNLTHRTQDAMAYFQTQGWSAAQAAGIVANLQRESGLSSSARGDHGQAFGIAQWHSDRQSDFERWAGYPIQYADFQKQLEFVNYELRRGSERHAGMALQATRTASDAARAVSRYYERPAAATAEANRRAAMATKLVSETTINVHGVHNPDVVADKVEARQKRTHSDAMRSFSAVVL